MWPSAQNQESYEVCDCCRSECISFACSFSKWCARGRQRGCTRALSRLLCLSVFCRIHSPWCCAWIAFLEKKELMVDSPTFRRTGPECVSTALNPSQSSGRFSQPHLVPDSWFASPMVVPATPAALPDSAPALLVPWNVRLCLPVAEHTPASLQRHPPCVPPPSTAVAGLCWNVCRSSPAKGRGLFCVYPHD